MPRYLLFHAVETSRGPHAIIWPSRDIIHGATSIVAAPLCENDTRTIKVSADRRYRLLFENNMRRDVNLLVFRRRLGLQRFLRWFGTIPSGAHLSFAFHCYAGQYAFRDASTGKTMLRVTARSAPRWRRYRNTDVLQAAWGAVAVVRDAGLR